MSLTRNIRYVLYRCIPKCFLFVLVISFYCEFLVYYLTQMQCSWPTLSEESSVEKPVHAMVLAEPHLAASSNENKLYNVYQEWQMERTFQTALTLHQPDLVFILGDLFEDGINCSNVEFISNVQKFHRIFNVQSPTSLYVVAGNHDIGYHNRITPHTAERFERGLAAAPARLVSRRGAHFVLLNSMALEGDGCMLCARAQAQIDNITDILKCSVGSKLCKGNNKLDHYSRPIIMQHFPLYRSADACGGARLRQRRDCVSREATEALVERLGPRAALAAHAAPAARACVVTHRYGPAPAHAAAFVEYTVPPFAPRLAPDPAYYLVSVSPRAVAAARCGPPGAGARGAGAALALALLLWLRWPAGGGGGGSGGGPWKRWWTNRRAARARVD